MVSYGMAWYGIWFHIQTTLYCIKYIYVREAMGQGAPGRQRIHRRKDTAT